jgi:hypothetical protein
MHAIASDANTPDILRRAFARVTCQIVRTFDDGSETVVNMTSRAKAEIELPKYAEHIGRAFNRSEGGTMLLMSVFIRDIADVRATIGKAYADLIGYNPFDDCPEFSVKEAAEMLTEYAVESGEALTAEVRAAIEAAKL